MRQTDEVLIQHNVPAAMRDSTTLMSNVYRLATRGEYPVGVRMKRSKIAVRS